MTEVRSHPHHHHVLHNFSPQLISGLMPASFYPKTQSKKQIRGSAHVSSHKSYQFSRHSAVTVHHGVSFISILYGCPRLGLNLACLRTSRRPHPPSVTATSLRLPAERPGSQIRAFSSTRHNQWEHAGVGAGGGVGGRDAAREGENRRVKDTGGLRWLSARPL